MIAAAAYWIGMGVALVIGLIYFRDLGDVSQMLIRVKRESMKRFIRNEYRFIALGFAGLVLMTVAHFSFGAGSLGLWWATLLLMAVLYGFPLRVGPCWPEKPEEQRPLLQHW
jgi:Na+/serine symporter